MPNGERRRLDFAVDALLAAVIAAAGIAETLVPLDSRSGAGSEAYTTVTVLVVCALLAVRRRFPLPVAVAVFALLPLAALVGDLYILFYGGLVPLGVAIFTVARHGRGREPFYGAGLAAACLVVADLTVPELQGGGEIVFHWTVLTLVWGAGFGLRRHERLARANLARAIDSEVAAAERTMAAVVDERTRIARELHDIVAHSVSMMVVQAGAAEQVVADDPAYAREALATIRETGAGALTEMRRVVAMLRTEEDGPLAPQPGVDGLPELIEDARRGGLDAVLVVDGAARRLPVGLDLTAYRIVQEALTNVRRHAEASSVQVRLTYGADQLCIEVADDGVGASGGDAGHGLIGMRERAALYGGRIETTSGPGFTLRAMLPLAAP